METDLLAPYYSMQLLLGPSENLLSLYPTESFDVSTGDNRFYCYVKVVDDLSAMDEAAIREDADVYEPLIYARRSLRVLECPVVANLFPIDLLVVYID